MYCVNLNHTKDYLLKRLFLVSKYTSNVGRSD